MVQWNDGFNLVSQTNSTLLKGGSYGRAMFETNIPGIYYSVRVHTAESDGGMGGYFAMNTTDWTTVASSEILIHRIINGLTPQFKFILMKVIEATRTKKPQSDPNPALWVKWLLVIQMILTTNHGHLWSTKTHSRSRSFFQPATWPCYRMVLIMLTWGILCFRH